jgi:hypothetical protein
MKENATVNLEPQERGVLKNPGGSCRMLDSEASLRKEEKNDDKKHRKGHLILGQASCHNEKI